MKPARIQRKRSKGWRMPDDAVYVGRGTEWGNPAVIGQYFIIGDPDPTARLKMSWCITGDPLPGFQLVKDRTDAVEWFRKLIPILARDWSKLRGKDLACWCPVDQPCHADVLLEIANG